MTRAAFPTLRRRAAQARHTQLRTLARLQAFDDAVAQHMTHGAMSGADPLTDSLYGQLEAPAAEGGQPAIGYSSGMQSRWQRLVAAWRTWRCSAWLLNVPQGFFTANATLAAGGLSEGAAQPHVAVLNCSQRHERCEVCPRFHAHRHGLAVRLDVAGQLDMARVADQVEAQPRHCHREAAQVHDVHADVRPVVAGHECPVDSHLQPHAVGIEGTPPVQHAQHRANDGRGQGDSLQHNRLHAGQHSSGPAAASRSNLPADAAWWLTGCTLLAALISVALLSHGAAA